MRLLALSIIILSVATAHGQYFRIGAGSTYGTYSMKGLKEFQQETLPAINFVPVKIVESFPSGFGYDINLSYSKSNFQLGGYYSFCSTGGRIHYRDYSGEIKFDQVVDGNSIGVSTMWKVNLSENYNLFLGFRSGLTISNLNVNNSISLGNQTAENISYLFKSINLNISPSIEYEYLINDFILFASLRYEANLAKSSFNLNGDQNIFIELDNGENLKADWNGVRISIGIKYRFKLGM